MKEHHADWKKIRALFPAAEEFVYLNAAEGSPISIPAAEEGKRFYDEMVAHGDTVWEEWLKRKEVVREKVARFIGADKEEVAFTLNTSHGMNLTAHILQGKGKGDVLTMEDEFPSTTLPWLNLNYKVRFVKPKSSVYTLPNIEKEIGSGTKILLTSYVQYASGFKQNLENCGKLCKDHGLHFVVNATQAMGAMPVNVKQAGIDFMVFSSLKWPMAGYGIGVLYINQKMLRGIKFPVVGWQSLENPDLMDNKQLDIREEASAIESGCPHFPNIFALGGALDLLNSLGQQPIQKRIYQLNSYLVDKLKDLGIEIVSPLVKKHRSGITVIKVRQAEALVKELWKRKVIVSARGEGIRISLHIYNNQQDILRFIEELRDLLE
jgi:selenocysteine lyase/cysteine desulfurase